MLHTLVRTLIVALSLLCPYATAALLEMDVDRPGSDYTSFDLPEANPQLCAARCAQDGRCQAFSYVSPGIQGPNARCWLKDQVPDPLSGRADIISGVKFEMNVDRPGSDYANFDLPAANPQLCLARCEQDGRCRAFSYVSPGIQGPHARCWLKDQIPNPVSGRAGIVSGVARLAAPPAVQPHIPPAHPPVQGNPGGD